MKYHRGKTTRRVIHSTKKIIHQIRIIVIEIRLYKNMILDHFMVNAFKLYLF